MADKSREELLQEVDDLRKCLARAEQAEEENKKLLHQLGERVKELTALHQIAQLLQQESLELDQLFQQVVVLLPAAWQYPEITAVRLTFDRFDARTPNFRESPYRLTAELITSDDRRGLLEVVYLEERPPQAEGPFLAEERDLLDSLAEMLRLHL